MIDYKTMFEKEEIRQIVLFLVGRKEDGISHPRLDYYCTTYGSQRITNIELINLVKVMFKQSEIIYNEHGGYKRGPEWWTPKFMSDKKYGIQ